MYKCIYYFHNYFNIYFTLYRKANYNQSRSRCKSNKANIIILKNKKSFKFVKYLIKYNLKESVYSGIRMHSTPFTWIKGQY